MGEAWRWLPPSSEGRCGAGRAGALVSGCPVAATPFGAPAGTPPEVVAKLNDAANKALQDPAVVARMKDFSAKIVGSTPEELGKHVTAELAKWTPVVKNANIQMD